jgi:hypothetical protein
MRNSKNLWLMGGLGNVLFQVLAYRVLKENGCKVGYVETLTNKNILTRLLNFTIHEKAYQHFFSSEDLRSSSLIKESIILFFALMSKKTGKSNFIASFYSGSSESLKQVSSTNIFGYFQHKDFLIENEFNVLKLGQELHKKYKRDRDVTVVHFRMGDSTWAKSHYKYYAKVRSLVRQDSCEVLIATDSPEEAMAFFSECENVRLTGAKSAVDDFRYLVSARKLYCAPSTFSWWAAHSLVNDAKIVVPSILVDQLGFHVNHEHLTVIG